MIRLRIVALLIVLIVGGVIAHPAVAQEMANGRWEILPLPAPSKPGPSAVSDMAVEPGGMLWVIINGLPYYWDGMQFSVPSGETFKSGTGLWRMVGGTDRSLYALQRIDDRNGKVYRLSDGTVSLVAGFYSDFSYSDPKLYVSKSGKLFNWGDMFLAVYAGGEWKRIETRLSLNDTVVLDAGETVYFYFNRNIACADKDDNLTSRSAGDVPFLTGRDRQTRAIGTLVGNTTAILFETNASNPRSCLVDLPSGNVIETPQELKDAVQYATPHNLFTSEDGSAWMETFSRLLRLSTDFKLFDEGNKAISSEYRASTSDGSMWFDSREGGGLVRRKDGAWAAFDWRECAPLSHISRLAEGRSGIIYVLSSGTVRSLDLSKPPATPPAEFANWQEIDMVGCGPLRDSKGGLWACLKDQPGFISRWDGWQWTHTPLPFGEIGVSAPSGGISDDQGHILLEFYSPKVGCFDISPEGIKNFPSLNDALVAAVARGVKSFQCGFEYRGCIALPGGHIALSGRNGGRNANGLQYYDGNAWVSLAGTNFNWPIMESSLYGMVIYNEWGPDNGRYKYYDRGLLIDIDVPRSGPAKFVLGPLGLQPYESGLLDSKPGLYVPMEREDQNKMWMLRRVGQRGECFVRGEAMDFWRLRQMFSLPALSGGLWTRAESSVAPYRAIGDTVFPCYFTGTPIAGLENSFSFVVDDLAGNTWFNAWNSGSTRRIFMHKAPTELLKLEDTPSSSGRALPIKLASDQGYPDDLRLFWRVDDGFWRGGSIASTKAVFADSGKHRVEVMALSRLGCPAAKNAVFDVDVKVSLPSATLSSKGPFSSSDIVWKLPLTVKPSEPGVSTSLMYRIDDGEWQMARGGRYAVLGGIKPGKHKVDAKAVEEDDFASPKAVSIDMDYQPDWPKIVRGRLRVIAGKDEDAAKEAMQDLSEAGPQIVPALREEIEYARGLNNRSWQVEELARKLERQ